MHRKNGSDKAFYFKQFHIHHDRCAMKVGTDGVLLGAWANVNDANQILDIGTGTGLIALMLAQRSYTNALITGIEIDEVACSQALENVVASPWAEKIQLANTPIQKFDAHHGYNLIVCNPPYFVDSLKSPDERRTQSRHTLDLSFSDLITAVKRLLLPDGIFCAILPEREAKEFARIAANSSLFYSKKLFIKSKYSKPIERLLVEFSFKSISCTEDELILYDENGDWTDSYRKLVHPFYLWA